MFVNLNTDSYTEYGREQILQELTRGASMLSRGNDLLCWAMYNNSFNASEFDYLTKIGGYTLPAKMRHIPKQRPYIEFLVSRFLERPFQFSVSCVDKKSLKRKLEGRASFHMQKYIEMHREKFSQVNSEIQKIQQKKQELEQQAQQNPQMQEAMPDIESKIQSSLENLNDMVLLNEQSMEKLKRLSKYSNKDIIEQVAQKAMKSMRQRLRIKHKSMNTFINSVVTGRGQFYVDYRPGDELPIFDSLVGKNVFYQATDNVEWIQDLDWAGFEETMTPQDVISEFRLHGVAKQQVESGYYSGSPSSAGPFVATEDDKAVDMSYKADNVSSGAVSRGDGVNVRRIWWVAERNVVALQKANEYRPGHYFTSFINQTEQKKKFLDEKHYFYKTMRGDDGKVVGKWMLKDKNDTKDEHIYDAKEVRTYDSRKGDRVLTKVIYDRFKGVVLDNNIYLSGKDPVQPRSVDNLSKTLLPIIGPTYNNYTLQPYSLIWATKDIQKSYNIVTYHRELMLAVAGTKTLLTDQSQKPEGMSWAEWRMRTKLGQHEIETRKKGVGMSQPTFNQFQAIDLSVSASIQYFDQILDNLDNQMGMIMGVTRQAMGQSVPSDQVGTFQMSQQSTLLVTSAMYAKHDEVERHALSMLINLARQYVWNTDTITQYVNEDGETEIVNIPAGLLNMSDYEIIISDNTLEERKLNELKQFAMQNYAKGMLPFTDFVHMYNVESLKELEKMSEYYSEEAMRIQQQSSQAEGEKAKELDKFRIELQGQIDMQLQKQAQSVEQMKIALDKQVAQFEQYIEQQTLALTGKKADQDFTAKMAKVSIDAEKNKGRESIDSTKNQNDYEIKQIEQRLKSLELTLNHATGSKNTD